MDPITIVRQALGIRDEAVGVKYTDDEPAVALAEGQYAVCNGILAAARGQVLMLSEKTCTCPGGRSTLGLTQARSVSLKMLVEGEKLWCDVKTATRSRMQTHKIASPPIGIGCKVYLYPMSKPVFAPDLVIFVVNAEQVSRLITLAQFWTGQTPAFEMRASLCWGAITYPLVSGNFNITVGDISARRMAGWEPSLMIATVPAEQIEGIAAAVDKTTAGTAATSEQFEKLTANMRRAA
jgi:uncharacterized protein (DUF169 family)